jgi:hypothetical protein
MPVPIETLQRWSQVLLWISIILPTIGAGAAIARYYVERQEKRLSAARAAEVLQHLQDDLAVTSRNAADVKAASDALQGKLEATRHESSAAQATLETKVSAAEATIKKAEAEVSRVREQAAPRTISAAQRSQLVSRLKQCGTFKVGFTAPMGDPEALELARALDAAFIAAGWTTTGVSQAVFDGSPVGILMRVDPNAQPKCAKAVQDALQAIGLPASGVAVPGASADSLAIVVGHKPRAEV